MHEAFKVVDASIVTYEDAPVVLEPRKQPLDLPASAVPS
jgi:hypothetical protein